MKSRNGLPVRAPTVAVESLIAQLRKRENRKIRQEIEILKANEYAPYDLSNDTKNKAQNLVSLSLKS
jgi:hypothetical protein